MCASAEILVIHTNSIEIFSLKNIFHTLTYELVYRFSQTRLVLVVRTVDVNKGVGGKHQFGNWFVS